MNPSISIERLLSLIFDSYNKRKEIFDIPEKLFYRHWYHQGLYTEKYGVRLHNPIGLSSGPLTQLAQNIIAGWICGARVIELKTMRPEPEQGITKPSIDLVDGALNCESAHELSVEQAYDQYLNAWIIIHILHHKYFSGNKGAKDIGTLFLMSLGYSLSDIRSEKTQWFIDKMMNCSQEKDAKINSLKKLYPEVVSLDIPNQISNSFVINTYPGCSAREIEYAGKFLMIEKKLHPTIKLNPILMGYKSVKAILEAENSFEIELSDESYTENISYFEAVQLIDNLQITAKEMGLELTVKVSGGLMCKNPLRNIPSKASHVYLSGRALHPVAVNLAAKLQSKYGGLLNLSFSGGADCFNISNLLMCGLNTITICTDLLKPGGYGRLNQYFQEISKTLTNYQVKNIKDLILKSATSYGLKECASENLLNYAIKTLSDPAYKRNETFGISIKGTRTLVNYDCISAPCTDANPMQPDVAGLCHFTAKNNPDKAFMSVVANNPLPSITGMAGLEHYNKVCTRLNYDAPVMMNDIERFISEFEPTEGTIKPWLPKNKIEVAVIGAGAAGISCAWFLNRLGFEVDVFEAEEKAGGLISYSAPGFRISEEAVNRDIQRLKNTGIKILANSMINKERYESIRENYSYLFIATGASQPDNFDFHTEETEGIIDGIDFLHHVKTTPNYKPGRHYAIIGSNYIAADAARTARRICGNDGTVTLITPDVFEKMTVDHFTLKAIEDEDIEIFDSAWVKEIVMDGNKATGLKLAETEPAMKNNKIVPGFILKESTQQTFKFDVIIACPKRKSGNGFFNMKNINKTSGLTVTKVRNVFAGGAFTNPKSTLASAIGDGKKAAAEIAEAAGIKLPENIFVQTKTVDLEDIKLKRFHRESPVKPDVLPLSERNNFDLVYKTIKPLRAIKEATRCFQCDVLCNVCVNVCPNKAIFAFEINTDDLNIPTIIGNDDKPYVSYESKLPIHQRHQVAIIADWCNNCGNCTTFCPSAGSPNRDKLRVHLNKDNFNSETNGVLLTKAEDHNMMTLKRDGNIFSITDFWDAIIFENDDCNVIMEKKTFKIERLDTFKGSDDGKMVLPELAEMKMLYNALKIFFQ